MNEKRIGIKANYRISSDYSKNLIRLVKMWEKWELLLQKRALRHYTVCVIKNQIARGLLPYTYRFILTDKKPPYKKMFFTNREMMGFFFTYFCMEESLSALVKAVYSMHIQEMDEPHRFVPYEKQVIFLFFRGDKPKAICSDSFFSHILLYWLKTIPKASEIDMRG